MSEEEVCKWQLRGGREAQASSIVHTENSQDMHVHPRTHPQVFPQRTAPCVQQTLPQVVLPGQTWSLQVGDILAAVTTETQLKSIIA